MPGTVWPPRRRRLSNDDLKSMGMIKIDDVQETVNDLIKTYPNTIVVPEGPYVVGMVE